MNALDNLLLDLDGSKRTSKSSKRCSITLAGASIKDSIAAQSPKGDQDHPMNPVKKFIGNASGTCSTEIRVENLNDFIFKRVPMSIPDFETGEAIPTFEYQVHNMRSHDCLLTLTFDGDNIEFEEAIGKEIAPLTIEGIVRSKQSGVFIAAKPLDRKANQFLFNVNVKCIPADSYIPDEDLDGVILRRRVSYTDLTSIVFEVENTKDISINATISIDGEVISSNSEIPIKCTVPAGTKVIAGEVKANATFSSSWKWTSEMPKKPPTKDVSELDGVILTKTIWAGNPSCVSFDVENQRDKDIEIHISIDGEEKSDLNGKVATKGTTLLGAIQLYDSAKVVWKWTEVSN